MLKGVFWSVVVVALAVAVALYYDHVTAFTGPVPSLEPQWWGPGSPRADDTAVKPFQINYPKEVLDDLGRRLRDTRQLQPPLEGVGFQYGFNTEFLQTVLDFWRTKYDWKERQAFLNSLPQFKMEVQGLSVHFIHAKPNKTAGVQVVPLLLVHGWPGSVREFYSLIPALTTPRPGQPFVFEVIAPSIPGYAFSSAAARPGLGPAQVAVVLHSLMARLGFKQFYAQGGDWGSLITTHIAQLYPHSVLGLHSNMGFVMPTPGIQLRLMLGSLLPALVCEPHEQRFLYPLTDHYSFLLEETGYFHLQATKPDTLGVALRDSPMGLAAYILEKFSTWTDPSWKNLPDGGLLKKFKLQDLLDNVMIYWLTGSATTSVRLYSEAFNKQQRGLGLDRVAVTVPSAIARFPHEIANQPRSILELKYQDLVQLSDFPTGGHFAAFEEPNLLADDLWQFVGTLLNPPPPPSPPNST